MALQPDGKIVVAGRSDASGSADFALARYHSDGTLDPDFGKNGTVTTDFGAFDEAHALVLQSNGNIVVAGFSTASGGPTLPWRATIPTVAWTAPLVGTAW